MDLRTAIDLLRRRGRQGFETAAERQVEIDALREFLGAYREQRDARVVGIDALLLEPAAVGAADAEAGLGERQRTRLLAVGICQVADPGRHGTSRREGVLDVIER